MKYRFFVFLGIFFWTVFNTIASAQYPNYFTYNDEKGLPTNEIYSIAKDNQGFICIGSDAGLFRYNGVTYQSFKTKAQKSRSLTGLTISSSGNLYCYNFIGQLFVQQGDSLLFLNREFQTLNNISADKEGNIFVSHLGGVSIYNEYKKQWKDLIKKPKKELFLKNIYTAKSTSSNDPGKFAFINSSGINFMQNGKIVTKPSSLFKEFSPGLFLLEFHQNDLFIFSIDRQLFYRYNQEGIKEFKNQKLFNVLKNRKLTKIKSMPDGKLWICTYSGIIQYDVKNDSVRLLYPEMSFSDCLIDGEGNYWFSTLQSGLLRVSNLRQVVWNKENGHLENDRITRLAFDGKHIIFANSIGSIGQLNLETNLLKFFQTEHKADIQSLDVAPNENKVFFSINNSIYFIENGMLKKSNLNVPATKTMVRVGEYFFFGSSSRLVSLYKNVYKDLIFKWVRVLKYDAENKNLWVACNDGLLLCRQDKSLNWNLKRQFLKEKQILSIEPELKTNSILAFGFDGMIYKVTSNFLIRKVTQLPENVQGKKIALWKDNIYVATNKGVFVFNQKIKKWKSLNKFSGLASNNIQDILIINDFLWLATGKGLQKFPIVENEFKPLAKISISKVLVNDKLHQNLREKLNMEYGQQLEVYPEVVAYSSQGNFKLAYRMNGGEWNKFPSNIGKMAFPTIPSGEFDIEIVAFDYLGRRSVNAIKISGYVYPPIWERTWFYFLVALIFVGIVFAISRYIIRNVRKKALIETELSNLKLTAIKAQMNPHFIFNALNSIQDLILKGDVENSYSSIITFSNLVRKTLDYSGKNHVEFEQEIELIKLYLALEKLRFKSSLTVVLSVPSIENILIPPMLIQPFIENALLHGLLHKEGERILTISFEYNEKELICIVEDNGIGRQQSQAIAERRGGKHVSFSGSAIEKRFEILNKSAIGKVGFHYEDLIEDGVGIGTKVTISIPFIRKF